MAHSELHPLITIDPISGAPLYVSELTSESTGISIRGKFAMPRFAKLKPDQVQFLEVFLRNRGMLNGVERELGISYPTVRGRLDAVLEALGLRGTDETDPVEETESSKDILDLLESGSIDPAEAKRRLSVKSGTGK